MNTTAELLTLPRGCTFTASDWQALAPFWYPVAFSHEVQERPHAARLLDERLVLYRLGDGAIHAARDLCLHRGAPLSAGVIEGDRLVCGYHGFRYDGCGQCVGIPAHPGAAIPPKLKLTTYAACERFGLVWVRLLDEGEALLPTFDERDDPAYLRVLPDAVALNAAAGRQIEGFLDVSHFAFIHTASFGERQNPEVPNYTVMPTPNGFVAD